MSQPAAQVALYSLRPALQNPGLTSMRKTYCSSHVRSSCEQYEALSQVSWQLIHGVERMVNDTAARAHRTEPQSLLRVLSPVLLPANARAREYLKSPRWKSPQDDRVEEYPESLERPGPRGAAVGPKHEHIATNTLLKTDEWAWLEDPILERFFLGNLQDPFWLDLILISPYFRQRLLDKRVERPFYIFLQQIAGTAPDGVVSALTLIHQAGASSEMELLLVASEHPITVGLPLKTFWWPQVIQPKLGDYQYSLFVRVLREWAQAELIEPAFELAKALLELHVEFPSKATGNELTRVRGKAPSYPYQQALDVMIDHLMPHEPMECLSLFAGLLHTLELELDAHEGIERFDALGYGRRAIEAHHQNTAMDLDDPLLDALRLTAESILEREVLPGAELVKQLSRYRGNRGPSDQWNGKSR